jgi:hypothetical protein
VSLLYSRPPLTAPDGAASCARGGASTPTLCAGGAPEDGLVVPSLTVVLDGVDRSGASGGVAG